MNPSLRHASESPLSQSAAADLDAIYAKIAKRIIPFLACLFVVAWLDRYNVGFAKLQMVKDLGFSEAVYGFGAGIVYSCHGARSLDGRRDQTWRRALKCETMEHA
jgi:hypothetical protein